MKPAGNKKGFTLVELLIVISIILALSAISVTTVLMFISEDKLSLEGDKIEVFLRRQRQRVRTTRMERRVILDFVRRSMRVYSPGQDRVFGSPDNIDAGEDDTLEEEFFLDKGLYFQRAVMKLEDYLGPEPFFENVEEELMPSADTYDEYVTGALLFKRDGTIELQKITPGTGEVDDESSINLDVSTTKWHLNEDADIIIALKAEPKRLLIDVKPGAGRFVSKVTAIGRTEEEEQPPEGEE
jgi:prepilin-type N-terminal cleavage/methylation domain-containing protein